MAAGPYPMLPSGHYERLIKAYELRILGVIGLSAVALLSF
jgi:hypothetical protein